MKFSFITVFFIFCTLPGYTQLQLSPVVGVNVSRIRTTVESYWIKDRPTINRFMGGFNVKYTMSDRFNLQLEGTYSQKGTEYQTQFYPDMVIIRSSHQINFIDLSTFGEFRFNKIYALNAGASFGINAGETFDGQKAVVPIDTKNDFSLLAGLKFYIGQFFLRTIYQHGISTLETVILTDENGMDRGQTNGHNQTFQIGLGYYFL